MIKFKIVYLFLISFGISNNQYDSMTGQILKPDSLKVKYDPITGQIIKSDSLNSPYNLISNKVSFSDTLSNIPIEISNHLFKWRTIDSFFGRNIFFNPKFENISNEKIEKFIIEINLYDLRDNLLQSSNQEFGGIHFHRKQMISRFTSKIRCETRFGSNFKVKMRIVEVKFLNGVIIKNPTEFVLIDKVSYDSQLANYVILVFFVRIIQNIFFGSP